MKYEPSPSSRTRMRTDVITVQQTTAHHTTPNQIANLAFAISKLLICPSLPEHARTILCGWNARAVIAALFWPRNPTVL